MGNAWGSDSTNEVKDEGKYVIAEDAAGKQQLLSPPPEEDDEFFFDAHSNLNDKHKGLGVDDADEEEEGFSLPCSPTSPSRNNGFLFDVFLSFRGEDTRRGFTGFLYDALKDKGVRTFIDSHKLEKGERLDKLFDYIQGSNIFVPIFSRGYADSKWCLKEIAEFVKCKRLIIPVFFDVEPTHVRRQTGPFESAFKRHAENRDLGVNEASGWRHALRAVGQVSGFNLLDSFGHEAKLVQLIVKRITKELYRPTFGMPEFYVGLDGPMQEVSTLLNLQSNNVKTVAIHGMGGIGKTTLAKAIYNSISPEFQASTFLFNIKDKKEEITTLQKKLLNDIFGDDAHFNDAQEGTELIKRRIHSKTVLVVLDDVDDAKQVQTLGCCSGYLSKRSRIIVTTRNKTVLALQYIGKHEVYELKALNSAQSVELFSYHAFGSKEPLQSYAKLSQRVASISGGLPLSLEVYGSLFFDLRSPAKWVSMLEKLEDCQDKGIHNSLKVSFDGLDDDEKEIFLDIACFFTDYNEKENAEYMWRDCKYHPDISLDVLVHRSLVKLNDKGQFEMHDQIRDMGRQIVMKECPKVASKRSRLWNTEEIIEALECPEGKSKTEGIVLDRSKFDRNICFSTESFACMSRLRLLEASYTALEGEYKYLPKKLKWVNFEGCHLESLPSDFYMRNMVILDLTNSSNMTHLWIQPPLKIKGFEKLKVLNLKARLNLVTIPDFSCMPLLEKLILDGCLKLSEVHESIGELEKLIYLSMISCWLIKELPESICELSSLQYLNLHSCEKISYLPTDFTELTSLMHLNISSTGISSVSKIWNTDNLLSLNLSGCRSLRGLPECIGKVEYLINLHLKRTLIERLPESIGNLINPEVLSLSFSPLKCLPDSIGNLKKLRMLELEGTNIRELPDSVGLLENLEKVLVNDCANLKFLPRYVVWKKLQILKISGVDCDSPNAMNELPENIGNLTNLKELQMSYNPDLIDIPLSFWHLTSIERLDARGINCWSYMHELGQLSSLKEIDLSENKKLISLPPSLECLSRLEKLTLNGCESLAALPLLPRSVIEVSALDCPSLLSISGIENSSCLRELAVSKCSRLQSLPQLPPSLVNLYLKECTNLTRIPDLSSLSELEVLNLNGCSMIVDVPGLHELKCLLELWLKGCDELESLPQLPRSIKILGATYCPALGTVSYFSKLKFLTWLDLSECKMNSLHGLGKLKYLEGLCMNRCCMLQSVPRLPPSLTFLEAEDCSILETISDVSNLKSLTHLNLSGCEKLVHIEGIENLQCIESLNLKGCICLFDSLKDRIIKESTFKRLTEFYISGSLLEGDMGPSLTFIHPKWFGFGGRNLNLDVVAEGLEDESQEKFDGSLYVEVMVDGNKIFEDSRKLVTIQEGPITYFVGESERREGNATVVVYFECNHFLLGGCMEVSGETTTISINMHDNKLRTLSQVSSHPDTRST